MVLYFLQIRKKDGIEFTLNSLYHNIVCGLMKHLQSTGKPGIDFFIDTEFTISKALLDSEIKRLQGQGVGSKKRY